MHYSSNSQDAEHRRQERLIAPVGLHQPGQDQCQRDILREVCLRAEGGEERVVGSRSDR